MTHPTRPVSLKPAQGPKSPIKKFFLRGFFLLLPTLITGWLLFMILRFLHDNLIVHASRLLAWTLSRSGLFSPDAYSVVEDRVKILPQLAIPSEIVAWIVCLVLVVFLGMVFGSIIGRRIWAYIEKAFMQLPPMRFIFPYVKQVTDFLFNEHTAGSRQVVAVEYPRAGILSIGFVTGRAFPAVEKKLGAASLVVFVPCSPTPMTGYIIFVRKDEVVNLPISMEEALKTLASGGVIKPEMLQEGAHASPSVPVTEACKISNSQEMP